MQINEDMPKHVIELINNAFQEANKDLKESKISVLGVAYKPDVDDARESPAIPIIKDLLKLGAKVFIYDPLIKNFDFELNDDFEDVILDSDAIVIITDHKEFQGLGFPPT